MKSSLKYRVSLGLAIAGFLFAGFGVDAIAQNAAGCFSSPAKMSDADISSFTSNPGALLTNNPVGGLPMTTQVRSLAGSSATALDALMGLVSKANSAQKSAIGAGLARVAKSCQAASPDYAQLIQQKIAEANDKELTAAFLAGMSDVQTAALGGGAGAGGGGGGAIGGNGGSNGSTGSAGGENSTSSPAESYSVGSGGSFTLNTTNNSSISN